MYSRNEQRETTPWVIILLAFLGLLDASYLTAHFFSGDAVTCAISNSGGCEVVTTSVYATIFGIPVALLGLLYYGSIFIFSTLRLNDDKPIFKKSVTLLVTLGFIFTLYLVYLQLFVLEAICEFCMFSALITTILFVIIVWQTRTKGQIQSQPQEQQ